MEQVMNKLWAKLLWVVVGSGRRWCWGGPLAERCPLIYTTGTEPMMRRGSSIIVFFFTPIR